jgi:hypothetical protein
VLTLLASSCLLGLFFDTEDGARMVLRNVNMLPSDVTSQSMIFFKTTEVISSNILKQGILPKIIKMGKFYVTL